HRGDVPASSEDITPPFSLIRTHAPIPIGSPLLRHLPRWRSLCRLLPAPAATGIFPTLSLPVLPRCLDPYHDGLQVALTCCFPCNIGLPQKSYGSACRDIPLKRLRSG